MGNVDRAPRGDGRFEIEESDGVVVSRFWDTSDVDSVHRYFDALAIWLAEERPFTHVLDTTAMHRMPDKRLRDAVAERLLEQADRRARLLRAQAVVVSNPLVRGAIHAVYWQAPPGYRWEIFARTDPAIRWARTLLVGRAGSGVHVRPSARVRGERDETGE